MQDGGGLGNWMYGRYLLAATLKPTLAIRIIGHQSYRALQSFSLVSKCPAPAFSSSTVPSARTSRSSTSTTLSPNAAAISSSVLCRVSL